MPANIEIKARIADLARIRTAAEQITETPVEVLQQEDTFFEVPRGRLKLRQFTSAHGQLIYYQRDDRKGPKLSSYVISATDDPQTLRLALASALSVRGVVKKTRWLYRVGQTRIHLDEVEGLGHFLELEVVMGAEESREAGERIAGDLMKKLGINEPDLVSEAYIDLV